MISKKTESSAYRSFLYKEMLVGNGLTNGIINGLICFLISRVTVTSNSYLIGTLITNAILGVIVINLYPIIIKSKLKKNPDVIIPYTKENHVLKAIYPDNTAVVRTINFVICFIFSTVCTMGIIGCCCLTGITAVEGAIFRAVDCGIYSALAYYFSVLFYKPSEKEKSV